MPRRKRRDYPGAWWHLMNRGADGCLIFCDEEEGRYFLSLLAWAVRKGWIEVHAWCLMPNHFHVEIRSPKGMLSRAMQWIEYRYAVWFNQRHHRHGTLFQGRFRAKCIRNGRYRRATFAYIHANPGRAGLDASSKTFWDSSAACHETGRGHPWVSRTFGRTVRTDRDALPAELVERWFSHPTQDLRELDALLKGAPAVVRAWLRREATRRDQPRVGRALVLPSTLRGVLRQTRRDAGELTTRVAQQSRSGLGRLTAGLLHTVCGMSAEEVGRHTDTPVRTAHDRLRLHLAGLREDDEYVALTARVLLECFRRDYGD